MTRKPSCLISCSHLLPEGTKGLLYCRAGGGDAGCLRGLGEDLKTRSILAVTRMEPTPSQRDYRRRFRAKGGFVPLAIVVGIVSLILLGALWSFIQGD